MKKTKKFISIILICVLISCGSSKPDGSDFLGNWQDATGALYNISKQGESFIISNNVPNNSGNPYGKEISGIFILTPERNLQRDGGLGQSIILNFNKENAQILASSYGNLIYLRKAIK